MSARRPCTSGLVGHEPCQRRSEPDRLGCELVSAAVAGVEDQIDDDEHRGQPVGQDVVWRHTERDPRRGDLAFGPHEPLVHGRLGDEERAGDLAGVEPAQRPQCERDLGLGRERRVAAGEDELQPLVGECGLLHRVLHCLGHLEQPGLPQKCAVAIDAVDRAVPGRRREPCAGVSGDAVARPPLGRDRERLLRRFLGEVEVAEELDQRSEDAAPLVAEDPVEDG
jgi:hypothetical protein